jgi:hypothetical protein
MKFLLLHLHYQKRIQRLRMEKIIAVISSFTEPNKIHYFDAR